MGLHVDTCGLGALTDHEDERRLGNIRRLLQAIAGAVHDGVISNVVQEELERAAGDLQQAIL